MGVINPSKDKLEQGWENFIVAMGKMIHLEKIGSSS